MDKVDINLENGITHSTLLQEKIRFRQVSQGSTNRIQ